MKELKALEVLTDWINGDYPSKKEIEDAKAELEAIQAPKTCDGCFWLDSKGSLTQTYCPKCIRDDHMEDRYVNKETR